MPAKKSPAPNNFIPSIGITPARRIIKTNRHNPKNHHPSKHRREPKTTGTPTRLCPTHGKNQSRSHSKTTPPNRHPSRRHHSSRRTPHPRQTNHKQRRRKNAKINHGTPPPSTNRHNPKNPRRQNKKPHSNIKITPKTPRRRHHKILPR